MAYEKLGLKDGTKFTAAHLAHIEDGIEGAATVPGDGSAGQVLTKTDDGYEWADSATEIPGGGEDGQVLIKTPEGYKWVDPAPTVRAYIAADGSLVVTN